MEESALFSFCFSWWSDLIALTLLYLAVLCTVAVLVHALMLHKPVGGRSFTTAQTEPSWEFLLCHLLLCLFMCAPLLTGSPYVKLFIFCCFWLITQWENTSDLLHDGVCLVCAILLSVMRSHWPLVFKWRTQLCSTGTTHSFLLRVVRVIFWNMWPWKI